MAEQTYSIKFDAQTGPFVKNLNNAEKATANLGKAQDALNKIALSSAAAQSPLQAIQVKSAQDLAKLNKLYQSGAITMQQYNTAVSQVIARQKAQIASMQSVSGGVRNMRGAMGQLGYQVQDVAVQLQMGQNAMLVFAQQGSQIASVFGPKGQVVGAIIAIAGAVGMSMIPSLKQAKENVEELRTSFENLSETMNGFGNIARIGIAGLEALDQLKLAENQKKLSEEQDRYNSLVSGSLTNAFKSNKELQQAIAISQAKIQVLKEENNTLKQNIDLRHNGLMSIEDQIKLEEELSKKVEDANLKNISALDAYEQKIEKMSDGVAKNRAKNYLKTLRDLEARQQAEEAMVASMERSSERQKAAQDKVVENAEIAHKARLDSAIYMLKQINKAEEEAKKNFEKMQRERQRLIDDLSGKMDDYFLSMINGTKAVSESFKSMAKSIIDDLARMYIQAMITKPLFGSLMGFSSSPAPVVDNSIHSPMKKAIGGPVSANTPYMVGEKGPELFIPNGSGKIVKNSDLGSQGVTVVQNINVSTGVQQTVRTEIMTLMPQIADAAKGAVLEARLRGGSYAKAFGG